jgi:ribosomal protein L11 methyltransferase
VKLLEISVEIDGEAAEAVSALFNQYGHGGAVTEELRAEDMSLPPVVRVKTFLTAEDNVGREKIEAALWHLGQIVPIPQPTVRWLAEADWADAWKAGYKAQRVGRHILIQPSWQPCSADPDHVIIELDPGMAFGTGLHPSTHLCLLALEDHVRPGQHVLDVGTGSGILAIAAIKLGARHVVATDIDDLALDVARENFSRNGVLPSVSLLKASLMPVTALDWPLRASPVQVLGTDGAYHGAFDLVLMNILPEVIANSSPALATCLATEGTFVVSGIIQAREDYVRQALSAAGLEVALRLVRKDWVALIGGKERRRSGNGSMA